MAECRHLVVAPRANAAKLPGRFAAVCCACDVMLEGVAMTDYLPAGHPLAFWLHRAIWQAAGVSPQRAIAINKIALDAEKRREANGG